MATVRIGEAGPVFGTIDQTHGYFENIECTTEVEETELMDGDSDVVVVDQHTKRGRMTFEFTYRAGGVGHNSVASGSKVSINASDSDLPFTSCYVRTVSTAKARGDYMKIRGEGTLWYPTLS